MGKKKGKNGRSNVEKMKKRRKSRWRKRERRVNEGSAILRKGEEREERIGEEKCG